MIKKAIDKKFVRFFISGGISFLVDTIVLALTTFLIFQGQNVTILGTISIPKLLSAAVGLTTNFLLNRNWVFKVNNDRKIQNQAFKFILFSIINVFFASIIYNIYLGAIFYLADLVHFDINGLNNTIILIANLATEGTKMVISFFGYKYFVFK